MRTQHVPDTPMSHKARKRFGQNFLHDQQIIDRIIASIAPQESDLLMEIGPGQAAITKPLIDTGAELHVIEIDRDLVAMRAQCHLCRRVRFGRQRCHR